MITKDKKKALMKLRDSFIKENNLDENVKMGFMDENENIGKIERLPTGFLPFDVLTGGGWVKNKINIIGGGESAGKTTKLLYDIGYWQKNIEDFIPVYIPAEKSFDREWAIKNGCDPEQLFVYEPRLAEENLDFVNKCAEKEHGVDCLIIDTLQALSSVRELHQGKKKDGSPSDKEKSTGDDGVSILPRLYSQFLRMYTSKTTDSLTLILTSQLRTDIMSMSRDKDIQTGGNAIKHYNVLNIKMQRVADSNFPIKDGTKLPLNSYAGKFTILKSKVRDRYKGLTLPYYFYHGSFDKRFNTICLAKDIGMFDGRSLVYNDTEFKARGIGESVDKMPDEAVKYLEDNIMSFYTKKVMSYEQPIEEIEESEELLDI